MDYSAILDAIARNMGPAPRRIGLLRRKWLMRPPAWLSQDSDMMDLFALQELLLREGRPAWGVIVQANRILFSTDGPNGALNAPADALYSLDPASRSDPHAMYPVAQAVYGFKEADADDVEMGALGAMLADEVSCKRGVTIPGALSPDYPTMMTSIFVERRHLPRGKLVAAPLPLLVLPERTDLIMIAPYWLWPQPLFAEWITAR